MQLCGTWYSPHSVIALISQVWPDSGRSVRRAGGIVASILTVITYAHPFLAVQTRLELARLHLGLSEPMGARTMLREIEEILALRPDLGTLVDTVSQLKASLSAHPRRGSAGSPTLTGAELRLLPMLCTHLTYQEIANELFLSKHTIHAQARSVFRKLGAKTRSEAVARSRELGLLDLANRQRCAFLVW